MIIYFGLLLVMTILGSVASLFLKKASSLDSINKIVQNWNIYIGAMLYLLSAFLNIIVLKYLDYSIVLPLTSLTYVWTMFISYLELGEKITRRKIGGIVFILIGAIFVSM